MKVFVIGSGGREHAQTWALAQSPQVKQIFSATTNAGIRRLTTSVEVEVNTPETIAAFAAQEGIDLVVVGPEQPLVDGVVDALAARGIPAFGPPRAAARLEGSKVFAKEFMARHDIPTARYQVVQTPEAAWRAISEFAFPLVVKADGLAAGKGVIIATDEREARQAVQDLLVERKLGAAGAELVIE